MTIQQKNVPEKVFWKWFMQNEAILFDFEHNQTDVLDEISTQLSKYREGITFEISQISDGKREFVISADGIKDLFVDVISLKNSAPSLDRWTVIAFRPRMDDYLNIKLEYGGKEFDPGQLWIYSQVEDGHFDLIIYYPDYSEEERDLFVSGSYILLDTALGEYDVTTGIRYIDHQRLPENPQEKDLVPFEYLRNIFDEHSNTNRTIN